jgi:hypothetical protein
MPTSFNARVPNREKFFERFVSEEGAEQGAIIAIGGRAAKCDETGKNKSGCGNNRRRLLQQSPLESLVADNNLGLGDFDGTLFLHMAGPTN